MRPSRSFDIQRNRACQTQSVPDCRIGCAGDDLEVNIPAVTVSVPENRGRVGQQLHGVIGGTHDPGTQKNSEQPLFPQIVHEKLRDFVGRKGTAARRVAVGAERTVLAVAGARIGKKRFEHDSISAPRQRNGIKPPSVKSASAVFLRGSRARAGEIILRIFRQNIEFFDCIHHFPF